MIKESSSYCKNCNKQVLIRANKTNHKLHFWLLMFSFGFWAIPYMVLACCQSPWRCIYCGSKDVDGNFNRTVGV